MRRKTHKGQYIDMETLSQNNEKSIAMGNMGVNAKGDKIGPGGRVLQTSQQRTRSHYTTPKTTGKVSLKDEIDNESMFPDETKKKKAHDSVQVKADEANRSNNGDTKASTAKKPTKAVEVENEKGDIVIEHREVDNK